MKCENENRCDLSRAIKKIADESNVSEEEVRETIKKWLVENYPESK